MVRTLSRTPEEALRLCVDALGGLQAVGHRLKGEDSDPVLAGVWLSHALTATCRDKLSLSQIVWIFREAHEIGFHAGVDDFAEIIGYRVVATLNPKEQLADLAREAMSNARRQGELSQQMEALAVKCGVKLDAAA